MSIWPDSDQNCKICCRSERQLAAELGQSITIVWRHRHGAVYAYAMRGVNLILQYWSCIQLNMKAMQDTSKYTLQIASLGRISVAASIMRAAPDLRG